MSTNDVGLATLEVDQLITPQEAIFDYEKAETEGDALSIDSAEPRSLDNAIDNIALKSAVRTLEVPILRRLVL